MKKALFWTVIVCLNLAVAAGAAALFLSRYQVVVYKKQSSEFLRKMAEAKTPERQGAGDSRSVGIDEFDYRRPHPYAGFKPSPSVDASSPTGPLRISTNALGQRSPDLPAEKKRPRVAMVGGSVAFQGTTNEDAIIARLARLLGEAGTPSDYVNASTLSFISNQETALLVQDLLDQKIDVLVSFDGFNDIHHAMYYNGRVGWPPMRWDDLGAESSRHMNQMAPSYYPPVKAEMANTRPDRVQAVLENYLANVERMAAICQAFGIRYVACIQPLKGFDPAVCALSDHISNELGSRDYFFCQAGKAFAAWQAERRRGAVYLNLADFFAARQELFTDDCHFTDQANELVAKRLQEALREGWPKG